MTKNETTKPELNGIAQKVLCDCPFCGGEAKLGRRAGRWGYEPSRHWAECTECGVLGKLFESEDEALDFWNSRHRIN